MRVVYTRIQDMKTYIINLTRFLSFANQKTAKNHRKTSESRDLDLAGGNKLKLHSSRGRLRVSLKAKDRNGGQSVKFKQTVFFRI